MTAATSPKPNEKFERLKRLLLELFQLDKPDLDFGIYRIMHARAGEISRFLDEDLLPQIASALAGHDDSQRAVIEQQLAKLRADLASAGVEPDDAPKVVELKQQLVALGAAGASVEDEVYDLIYRFFRRYYSEGDFLSHRVYKEGVYAVPYEGEEVMLHWANKDQYYIKTSEHLRDYSFRLNPDDEADPMRAHFRLVDAAEGEHGNVKAAAGKARLFVLAEGGAEVAIDRGELTIRFEYRPVTLTDWPDVERADKGKPPTQKDLNRFAAQRILSLSAGGLEPWLKLLGVKHVTSDGRVSDSSRLLVHLDRYTARNTFDYFIHTDLGGFLRRELDFFIKNEVMRLDDIENESAQRVEQYLSKIKVLRSIAGKIIDFLAQLEDFQKKLWLKKKMVIDTSYLITLGSVPEEFYDQIAASDEQREEWVDLFAIDEINGYSVPLTADFMSANPTLVVNTDKLPTQLSDAIVEHLGEGALAASAVLIQGENSQALRLIERRWRSRVDAIYIDPPYNTKASEIAYKNSYKHSSWLAFVAERVRLGRRLMAPEAVLCVAIDDAEFARLQMAMFEEFGENRNLATVVVRSKPQGRAMASGFSQNHEYALFFANGSSTRVGRLPRDERRLARYGEIDHHGIFTWANFRKTGAESDRTDRPLQFFPVWIDTADGAVSVPELDPLSDGSGWVSTRSVPAGLVEVLPCDDDGTEKVWTMGVKRTSLAAGEDLEGRLVDGVWQVFRKYRPNQDGALPGTWWSEPRYSASESGTKVLQDLLGVSGARFSYPKSVFTVEDCLRSCDLRPGELVLDFFGGSGTTAQAVINLNRIDAGARNFCVVEVADYFDDVLIPRLKKVLFAPEWRDGKPVRRCNPEEADRTTRVCKIIRLESYEDALNNLDLRRTDVQQTLLDHPGSSGYDGLREQYLLRYMLNVESRGSQSLLNLDSLCDPVNYWMSIKRPGSDESRVVTIDIIETFNWLIGLAVERCCAPRTFRADFERDVENRLQVSGGLSAESNGTYWFRTVEGTTSEGLRTLVIWRNRPGGEDVSGIEADNLVLNEWFMCQGYSSGKGDYDLIYVNGDNSLESLRAPSSTWKVRLIEDDFHRLMFDTEGE